MRTSNHRRPLGGGRGSRRNTGGRPATAAPWTPASLTNLRLDLDASLGITLVGADVNAWADQSGVANDFAAQFAGNRPLFVATGFNGGAKPYVEFDGGTEALRRASFSWGGALTAHTIAMVVQYVTTVAEDRLCMYSTLELRQGAGGTGRYFPVNTTVLTSTTLITTPRLIIGTSDGTSAQLYIGSTSEGGGPTAAVTNLADSLEFNLGAATGAAAAANARIARVWAMRARITPAEITALSAYAAAQYGV